MRSILAAASVLHIFIAIFRVCLFILFISCVYYGNLVALRGVTYAPFRYYHYWRSLFNFSRRVLNLSHSKLYTPCLSHEKLQYTLANIDFFSYVCHMFNH